MRDKGIGFLPVCDAKRRVLGTLTDRDIVIRWAVEQGADVEAPVERIMTREVISCHADDDIDTCEERMATHKKSRILILDDDTRLIGVISLSDLAQCGRARRAGRTLRQVTTREAG
jgi:CBS domain-containing protein